MLIPRSKPGRQRASDREYDGLRKVAAESTGYRSRQAGVLISQKGVTVRDFGPGIAREHLPRLTEASSGSMSATVARRAEPGSVYPW
ncbi:hypothetical protein LMTR3_33865 [Bradyrhizobium sp. LMTR 3]|nr:hypothetical protein LMTR3_33865 [Bradyrhizobium sp. LMTR 3]